MTQPSDEKVYEVFGKDVSDRMISKGFVPVVTALVNGQGTKLTWQRPATPDFWATVAVLLGILAFIAIIFSIVWR